MTASAITSSSLMNATPFQPGDRVLFGTALGELPAMVWEAHREPPGRALYTVEVDGTPSPRTPALASQPRPLDDADAPHLVPAVSQ
jgi:hypothetical protein